MPMHEPVFDDHDLLVEAIDHDHIQGGLFDVYLMVWAGHVTEAAVESLDVGLRLAAQRGSGSVMLLGVILPGAPMTMSREARDKLSAVLSKHAASLRGIAMVSGGDTSITRWLRSGLVSSIAVAASGVELRGFGEVDEALAWTSDCARDEAATPDRLKVSLEDFRDRLDRARNPEAPHARRDTIMLCC